MAVKKGSFPLDREGIGREVSSIPAGYTNDGIFYWTGSDGKIYERVITSSMRAVNCGIYADGTDMTSRLQAAVDHAKINEIIFDVKGGGDITINGAVNVPTGKVLKIYGGTKFIGTGTIDNAIIRAHKRAFIFDTSIKLTRTNTWDGKFSLMWYGAKPVTSAVVTALRLQTAVDNAILSGARAMVLPRGVFNVNKGIVLRKDSNGDGLSDFFGCSLEGEVKTFGDPTGVESVISLVNSNSFALGIHRGKGVRIKNIFVQGQNSNIQNLGTTRKWCEDPAFDWGLTTFRNNSVSPHCGFAVDPLGTTAVASGNRYPDFSTLYTDASNAGSTDVIFEHCVARYFIIGYCMNPGGLPQNGDAITIRDSWGDFNYVSVSTGESQNRSIFIENFKVWGGVETVFDCKRYGDGTSNPVEVDGLNIAGGVRNLCRLTGFGNSHGISFKRVHAELLYSLGGNFEGDTGDMLISDSWFQFTGNLMADGDGTSTHHPISIFRGGNLTVIGNTYLTYYGSGSGPISFSATSAVFDTVQLDDLPLNTHPVGQTTYRNCRFGIFNFGDGGTIDVMPEIVPNSSPLFVNDMTLNTRFSTFDFYGSVQRRKIYNGNHAGGFTLKDASMFFIGPTIAISNIVDPDVTVGYTHCEFTLTPSTDEFKMLQVGDKILGQATDEYGRANILHHFGTVVSKNNGTGLVVVKDIRLGLTAGSYALFLYRPHKVIPVVAVGNCIAGNVNVSGIVIERNATQLPIGVTIISPYFPQGTYLVSYDGAGNAVFSNPANATVNGFDIISSDWKGRIHSSQPSPTHPLLIGFKKGDEIFNISPGQYNTVMKWMCIKSGVTNTAIKPAFIATEWYPDEFTATGTDQRTVEGYFTLNFKVKASADLTGFKIGTTAGGADIFSAQPILAADGWVDIRVDFFDPTITTIYFGGITASTDIKIMKSEPVAIV
jgi:hypothetical protein